MLISADFGETITVSRSALDDLGNRLPPATHTVDKVAFEVFVRRDSGDQPWSGDGKLFAPRGSDLLDADVVTRPSGMQWKVNGPAQWDHVHPLTGADFGYCEYQIERGLMADDFLTVDIHNLEPNILIGPEVDRIMLAEAERARVLYMGIVHKRSTELADSAVATTELGGMEKDRRIGRMTVGQGLVYGASHEYGTEFSEGVTAGGRRWVHATQEAADDLEKVLGMLHA